MRSPLLCDTWGAVAALRPELGWTAPPPQANPLFDTIPSAGTAHRSSAHQGGNPQGPPLTSSGSSGGASAASTPAPAVPEEPPERPGIAVPQQATTRPHGQIPASIPSTPQPETGLGAIVPAATPQAPSGEESPPSTGIVGDTVENSQHRPEDAQGPASTRQIFGDPVSPERLAHMLEHSTHPYLASIEIAPIGVLGTTPERPLPAPGSTVPGVVVDQAVFATFDQNTPHYASAQSMDIYNWMKLGPGTSRLRRRRRRWRWKCRRTSHCRTP